MKTTLLALIELGKPKVVLLMLLSALVGMLMATRQPEWLTMAQGLIGIGLFASAGGAFNHVADRMIDQRMARTQSRPLPQGNLQVRDAILWACLLSLLGWLTLAPLSYKAAYWTLGTLLGYAWIYTCLLKRATPQNIVIGGLSGALPPLLGWLTVNHELTATPWLLVLIIFAWTPPHFWALSLAKLDDYQRSQLPMLPVTHGPEYTRQHIWYYSILTVIASILPVLILSFGMLYLIGLIPLSARWLVLAWGVKQQRCPPMRLFVYSITYLMSLFLLMLLDHWLFWVI